MKFSAKRIRKGLYEYRGFIIQQWNNEDEIFWNVSVIIGRAEGYVNTLKQGKKFVDMYHESLQS